MSAGIAVALAPGDRQTRADSGAYAAPLLLGAMLGALIAGRVETGVIALALAWLGALRSGAEFPGRGWLSVVAGGAVISLGLNLYLVRGHSLGGPTVLGLAPTREGLLAGCILAVRLAGASLAVHGLRSAWPGERAADEAARALRPLERLRIPVGEARTVLGLALRFAPLIAVEARRIAQMQELRSGHPARSFRERFDLARASAVPIVVSALERAERVSLALEARHYRARPPSSHAWAVLPSLAGLLVAGLALLWRA